MRQPAADRRPRIIVSIFDDEGNPHYAGGGPRVVQRIVESLTPDYRVLVLTGGYRGARRSHRHGATYVPLPVGWAGPRLGQLLFSLGLLVVAAAGRYDLWVESFTPPFSSSFLPWVSRRPVIGVAQALSGRDMARRYHSRLFVLVERVALRRYRDVVVLNEHDAAQVLSTTGHTRVHHIPNLLPAPPADVGSAADGTYALFLGRIEFEQKGLGLLLEAYERLGEDGLPLVVAGGGRARELARLQKALESTDRVRHVGQVTGPTKRETFAGAAFVVVPSREESFCLVALEALAHGRPVVRFDLPQLSWIPADCGAVVPRFDTAALAQAVRELSSDGERRHRAGELGKAFADSFLSRQDSAAYSHLVGEVLREQAVVGDGRP